MSTAHPTAAFPASPPASPVDPSGVPRFGIYDAPFADVDVDRTRLSYAGLSAPPALAGLRLKQWQHFAIIDPELLLTFAIVDAGYVGVGWCQVVERAFDGDIESHIEGHIESTGGRRFEHHNQSYRPDVAVARALWDGHSHYHAPGLRLDVHSHLAVGRHEVSIACAASSTPAGDLPSVRAELTALHDLDAIQPLVVVLPVGRNRAMYSHKVALPVEGEIWIGDRQLHFDPAKAVALLDIHKAHYPHHTFWRWSTLGGRDAQGRLVGLNLTKNVVTDDRRYHENALFLDGRVHLLSPAVLEPQTQDRAGKWHVGTEDGEVDLEFTPDGSRSENLRMGIVQSVFHQHYGTYRGTIRVRRSHDPSADDPSGGAAVDVDGLVGLLEDHDARW